MPSVTNEEAALRQLAAANDLAIGRSPSHYRRLATIVS